MQHVIRMLHLFFLDIGLMGDMLGLLTYIGKDNVYNCSLDQRCKLLDLLSIVQ